ncbi:PP2C family protein-serine/threonine phosphatase [Streptomyces decoyicus]|uniref:PP2C family protein-serine/threonine phosphatase n=1 Tax=Streptomyces decoyicus TaxID=249567 RepID=UPI0004AAFB1C|nr:SpoIIE family protein phosphatase [Streptomyces decoyicus]KOG47986.1 protein phosphatase [Streptomyces decoyicus]QZY19708.1 SpoIIE family protein phosphatase [Streptomyces decoyicus]
MSAFPIDYAAVFQALPGGALLLTPQFVIADANAALLQRAGRERHELIGRPLFDVFPDNPDDPGASGMRNLRASLERVVATGARDSMALQRYDIEAPGRPGTFEERYWSPVNVPVLDADGRVRLIVHRVEEVTEIVRAGAGDHPGDRVRMEAELFTRAQDLQEVNERLRRARVREREVVLALQEAMLPAPGPVGHHRAAVRYRPAVGALNVCGDWYDLADLPGDRMAVAVGDVVGHGLAAACVMGQLRSALSAAARVADGPARALEVLGIYARSVDGAESTTAVQAVIDWSTHTLSYSSAGHPPPALLHPDGTVELLDRATDPPLGARPEHVDRPEAQVAFADDAVLVLYTDGLIERRHEDIDVGLARLAEALTRHRGADAETLADALLADLLPPGGATDDAALVIIRL